MVSDVYLRATSQLFFICCGLFTICVDAQVTFLSTISARKRTDMGGSTKNNTKYK
jgi:hypothetical protein